MINSIKHKGFTIVETLVAIIILALAMGAILTLVGTIINQTKFQKKEIVANYLIQEGLEYVRNNRDSSLNNGVDWAAWINPAPGDIYQPTTNGATVYSLSGCFYPATNVPGACAIDALNNVIIMCPSVGSCPNMSLAPVSKDSPASLYCLPSPNNQNCDSGSPLSGFQRSIRIVPNGLNEAYLDVTVEWDQGTTHKTKTVQQSLLNW